MIVWLDHKIFGSGHGLKSPHFDDVYYWLDGQIYTFCGGFGAQLKSFQWRMPRPGERRRLCNREFVVFGAHRCWGRVMVSWAMTPTPKEYGEIQRLKDDLENPQ